MTKSDREIMEILEAFDLTRCAHSAAVLAGCDPKTVAGCVVRRDAGRDLMTSRESSQPENAQTRIAADRSVVSFGAVRRSSRTHPPNVR